MIKILRGRFDEKVGHFTLLDRLRQQRRGHVHAEVKQNVVEMPLAMFDERGQPGWILITKFKPQKRRSATPGLDVRCQAKFSI